MQKDKTPDHHFVLQAEFRNVNMGVILTVAAFQAEGRACPERSRRDLAR
jgi:hypothetical protein